MRRAAAAVAGTILGLVLLLGFKSHPLGSHSVAGGTQQLAPATGGTGGTGTAGGTGAGQGSGGSGSTTTGTVTGDAVDTRWGPVQVKVTLSSGRITEIAVLEAPANNPRDIQINDYALPVLRQEALAAQSAQIDSVSGATYTSEGYIGSLQSALDRAGH